ncbi:zinc ABC transporter substrate-binding protein ZnuA [Hoeflea sp. TYP-13]|uniref:zinc ABC transporter substrate-binding protein ZnuA n=1 Tax=Hoeflea sp. TYP-13 TaxID=3230023 RepID=UPI0034C5E1AE
MKLLRTLLLASTACVALPAVGLAEPAVVTSIKPIHSLVAGVMDGVGDPELLVDGAASPHTYSLRPSQAGNLERADIIFWFGPDLEAFLEKPLDTLADNAMVVELGDAHDLVRLGLREGGTFESHDHEGDEHADDGHDDHEHDDDEHADHEGESNETHAGHDHDAHADGEFNIHLWLDPVNAKALVHEIEEALVKTDPENAAKYKANAEGLEVQLDELTTEIATRLEPVKDKSFVVFHDAYPYFENRFGVSAAGSVTISPEVAPGAARVSEIRNKVKELGATCVFSEPQFEPKLVDVITEGTGARAGVLDPLGADLENGPDLYFTLIRNMADNMLNCLSDNS